MNRETSTELLSVQSQRWWVLFEPGTQLRIFTDLKRM